MKRCMVTVLSIALLLCACGAKESTWQEQYDLGVKYLSEGSYQEAVIAFTAAIEIDPKQASAYVGRADAYIAIGSEENLEAALKDYYVALELDSLSIDIYRRIAEVYIRQR